MVRGWPNYLIFNINKLGLYELFLIFPHPCSHRNLFCDHTFYEFVQLGVEGLQTMKPHAQKGINSAISPANGIRETSETFGGINLEVQVVISEDNVDEEMVKWIVENVKLSVKQPVIKNFTSRCALIAASSPNTKIAL